jgi:hypothetical protein
MTETPNAADEPRAGEETTDVADLGDRARADESTPSSGPFDSGAAETGTAAGDPLAGVGTPQEEPAYPEGSEEHLEG